MKLNKEQQEKVLENVRLVGQVIKDKVHDVNKLGICSYEDLIQIGYIGLCKAVYTDKGGYCFSTYAYRLIWQEICDALIKYSKIQKREVTFPIIKTSMRSRGEIGAETQMEMNRRNSLDTSVVFRNAMNAVEQRATPAILKGIYAVRYVSDGYNSREIGRIMNVSDGKVRMWITRARRYLSSQPEILEVAEEFAG